MHYFNNKFSKIAMYPYTKLNPALPLLHDEILATRLVLDLITSPKNCHQTNVTRFFRFAPPPQSKFLATSVCDA